MSRPSTTNFAPSFTPRSTYPLTFSKCSFVTRGPISEFLSRPGPTFKASTFFDNFSTSLSPIPPTATATDCAIHLSPAEP